MRAAAFAAAAAATGELRVHPLLRRDAQGRVDISRIGEHIAEIMPPHLGIVNGSEVASASEFPYMSSNNYAGVHACGAALIAPQWVLTAAHCGSSAPGREFSFGSTQYTASGGATLIGAAELYRHPSFNPSSLDYDAAVVQLNASLGAALSKTIATIAVAPASAPDFAGTDATVTGWGANMSGGLEQTVLREVSYPIISNGECGSMYSGVTDRMLCAYTPGGGRDACQGDSGGPLVVKQNGGAFLHVGIVSWGQGCAGDRQPGVYSRTSALSPWICKKCDCC